MNTQRVYTVFELERREAGLRTERDALAESHAELLAALSALHDGTDNMNCEFAQPALYCCLCHTKDYDSVVGVQHREHCSLYLARIALAKARKL